jgi:hypothetical protein
VALELTLDDDIPELEARLDDLEVEVTLEARLDDLEVEVTLEARLDDLEVEVTLEARLDALELEVAPEIVLDETLELDTATADEFELDWDTEVAADEAAAEVAVPPVKLATI